MRHTSDGGESNTTHLEDVRIPVGEENRTLRSRDSD